jgi:hypothetical protein
LQASETSVQMPLVRSTHPSAGLRVYNYTQLAEKQVAYHPEKRSSNWPKAVQLNVMSHAYEEAMSKVLAFDHNQQQRLELSMTNDENVNLCYKLL